MKFDNLASDIQHHVCVAPSFGPGVKWGLRTCGPAKG